jgi:hypothetical protein
MCVPDESRTGHVLFVSAGSTGSVVSRHTPPKRFLFRTPNEGGTPRKADPLGPQDKARDVSADGLATACHLLAWRPLVIGLGWQSHVWTGTSLVSADNRVSGLELHWSRLASLIIGLGIGLSGNSAEPQGTL